MKNILVTGGLGFIGHNVVQLLEKENNVIIFDSETDYGFVPVDELKYLMTERKGKVKSKSYNFDIRDRRIMNAFIKDGNFDTIVHLASFPRQKVVLQDPTLASDVMMTGLITLLESARLNQVRKFVYVSSSMVYGDFENDVTEDAVCSPKGQYGIMKYAGEQLVKDYASRTGMSYTIIRPSAVYGESDVEDRVVSKFIIGALRGQTLKVKGATEVLDFTYVKDLATGIALATELDAGNDKIYNLTRSDPTIFTLLDAANLAVAICGKGSVSLLDKDSNFPSRGRLNISRARTELGFNPTVDITEGFNLYTKWFKESKFWQTRV